MKILLLDLGKQLRGGQRQVHYLARHLSQEAGFEPIIAAPKGAPLLDLAESAGIPTHTLVSSSDLNPINVISFFKLLKQVKPDIVHTNDAKGASLAALAKTSGKARFKLVHTRRVSYKFKKGWSTKKYLAGDAVVGVSREIQKNMVQCGVEQSRSRAIHSGIDLSRYTTEKLPNDLLTIGTIGALTKQKGIRVLLDALKELKKDDTLPAWQCIIAGDGPLMKELQERAHSNEINDRILFLGYKDSREILQRIDILAVPSVDGEGSNAVIKEGWATGTPLVSSNLASNLELVTGGQNGLVFANRDSLALASALKSLMTSKTTANKIRKGGFESVRAFTDKAMAEQYVSLYRELVR
ncbi:glycosyltransferase family 4 protein [Salidesulfovibrio onnuriiensis]|uniref:glycosyltransferase family 4 protein n=1 Tax=Salidesulfovibrio onnuriiensis TaxID=2583823 RepID=UPI0011CA1B48|nr:glycosyltransferase family 4 protein [Salidesulfovibrio onnuriiensis]